MSTALAIGYNRMRSERLSEGRPTVHIIEKIRIDKKNLREINEDSTEENLLNSAKVIEEEEEVDEEEEGEEEEKEEEVKDEGKDYEATLMRSIELATK
ncbi:hypothetical protein V1478_000051 [Vespula squamosa]|uniref:Uncharacterized protein n=1 Tax=Vespula squamosa TaxID=30214 RepID=A0ABD2C911_VESSQ